MWVLKVCVWVRACEVLLRRQRVVRVVCISACFVGAVRSVFLVWCVLSKTRGHS